MLTGSRLATHGRQLNAPMTAEPTDHPVLYSSSVFVRTRRPGRSWVSWNHRLGGGPKLVVRTNSFEASAPREMLVESQRGHGVSEIVLSGHATLKYCSARTEGEFVGA